MDRERAKFILTSFRPDGADTQNLDFAEALKVATLDRELGEWLTRERAFDADFAEALARVDLPEGLRESVLLAMVQGGGNFTKVDQLEDEEWIGAMAGINVPEGLRDRVLIAMDQSAKVIRVDFNWRKVGIPLAAAAGIAMAFMLVREDTARPIAQVDRRISIHAVEAGFRRTFESPIFSLDKFHKDREVLISHLKERGLPCGDFCLPKGLDGVESLGCRELMIDGMKGSLVCFDEKNGTVHLIIFNRDDVKGDLPDLNRPHLEQSGDWAVAYWADDNHVFTLLGIREKEQLAEFF
ncbi:MAG: hypothetical protein H7Y36_09025 [Armatimonadetes bacterium]|nr:hypothetical protein [Akkermansiaceae bacterium]